MTTSLHSIKKLSWLLDKSIRLPGGYRIGLDGLIGLIPGVGDVVSGVISGWIIWQARRAGVPRSVMMKMIFNTLLDTLLGSIPIIGDLFDFAFQANSRNIKLLEKHLDQSDSSE